MVLMYDVGRAATFDTLSSWLTEIKGKCAEPVSVVLVGNKVDCEVRAVPYEQAAQWAREHNLPYIETSAKKGTGVRDAFITVVATAAGRAGELSALLQTAQVMQAPAPQYNTLLAKPPPAKTSGCAC